MKYNMNKIYRKISDQNYLPNLKAFLIKTNLALFSSIFIPNSITVPRI